MGIDPTLHYCTCGCSWRPGTYHKIIMLLFGEYSRKCPQCQTVMKFMFVGHVVKVDSKRVLNERIWENG